MAAKLTNKEKVSAEMAAFTPSRLAQAAKEAKEVLEEFPVALRLAGGVRPSSVVPLGPAQRRSAAAERALERAARDRSGRPARSVVRAAWQLRDPPLAADAQPPPPPPSADARAASEADYFTRRAYFLAQAGSKLAALLKHNHQLSSGSKLEQAVRCAEFELLGGLPKCPHCKHAVLKVSRERSLSAGQVFYHCTGRSEAGDAGAYVPCSFTAWAKDLPRLRWAASLEEPAPEQEEARDAGGASADAADLPALGAEAEGVTDVKAGVTLVEGHAAKAGLALPKDAMVLKTEVAGLLTAHRGPGGAFDIAAVLAKLAAKYPKAAVGRVTAARQGALRLSHSRPAHSSYRASALVPENDALARAFDKVAADMAAAGEEGARARQRWRAHLTACCLPCSVQDEDVQDGERRHPLLAHKDCEGGRAVQG